jgi:hypothetical protein
VSTFRFTAALLAVLVPFTTFAQSDRGTLTGTVSDAQSAIVQNARVVAINEATGAQLQTITTETGNFTLAQLPAGAYRITVEAPGFKRTEQNAVQVQVAQTTRLDLRLDVGATTESVTVSAEAPMLRTENAEQSVNVSGNRINNLPINFGGGGGSTGGIRNWMSFIQLAPGVSGTNERASINGSAGGAFKVIVEGQDLTSSNDTIWTSSVSAASVEMISEFSFQASNFAAEFGQTLGGVFNFTTKSGTNQFRGSLFEYFTNEALDARRPFAGKPISRKHDFGGTIGGPVWIPKIYNGRNKTFFFFNYERFRVRTRATGSYDTVPTEAFRNGDFSSLLTGRQLTGTDPLGRPLFENVIYDPQTERVAPNGQLVRDPFPGNIIPRNRMDPVALKIQGLIPAPNRAGNTLNWLQNTATGKFQDIPAIKVDHNFTDAIRTSFYYSVQNTDQITANDGLPLPITERRDQSIYGHTTRLNYDHSLTPTVFLHLGAGYVRFHNPDSSPADVLQYDATGALGLIGSATNPAGFPRITGLSTAFGGMRNMGPTNANKYYDSKATGVASMSWVRGNHTYKFGGEYRLNSWTDYNANRSQGSYAFSAEQTGLPSLQGANLGGGSVGFGYASFLLGLVNNASVKAVQDPQWRKSSLGLFAQDTWKVTRRLTLDYGLRWDYAGQGHEIHYRNSMFGPTIPNPAAGGRPGGIVYEGYGAGRCDCEFTDTYPWAFGPRLGIAYQLNPRTVVRAGWGVTYSALANWWYVTGGTALGVGFNDVNFSTPAYAQPALLLQNGLNYDRSLLYTATLDPGLRPQPGQLNSPSGGYDRNGGRPGRVQQWNIAIQRELTRNLSLEAAYVGNRGVWLEANDLNNINAISEERLRSFGLDLNNPNDRTLLTSRIDSAVAAQRGFNRLPYAGFPTSATVAQSLRPFPQFSSSLNPRWAPLGSSWYDSLQMKLTQRYSRGLDYSVAFTWQKELALGTGNPSAGGNGLGATVNDVFNRQNQKSLASSSQPFILVIGFNYQTPKFTSNKVVSAITRDWLFGGVLRYASGALIGSPASQSNLNSLVFQNTRMNRVPGEPLFLQDPNCHCIDPNKEFVLNPKAWVEPPAGQFGTSAGYYNDYRWQRQASESASIGRMFQIRERLRFQVRGEFFNIFNRLNLPTPTSNNPLATQQRNATTGVPISGFGFINANNAGGQRNGQLVARFEF